MPDFEHLRNLADLLDLHLGVEKRKSIMEGNEKLTSRTDPGDWTIWMAGVQSRLSSAGGKEIARNLMHNMRVMPGDPELPGIEKS